MALPTYKAAGTYTYATGAITPPYPTGGSAPVLNDIALLIVESENQAISLSVAQGFVELGLQANKAAGTGGTDPASRLAVYWKRCVGSDVAPTVAATADHLTGQILLFSGCKTSGNPWNIYAEGNDGGANDTTGVIPGATTTVANCLIVLISSTSYNGSSTTEFTVMVNANLANIVERIDNCRTTGLGGGFGVDTGEKAAAGAYVNSTTTLSHTSYKGATSIALEGIGAQTISNAGAIPSAEAFGTSKLNLKLAPTGIATGEAFGNPQLNLKVFPTGVATQEAFGTAKLVLALLPTGIPTLEAFGAPQLNFKVFPTGVVSEEVFGNPKIIIFVNPSGLASAEAFGIPTISSGVQFISNAGAIASLEAFGISNLNLQVSPSGVATMEAFGNPKLNLNILPIGIVSSETFGAAKIILYLAPVGIVTGEAWGTTKLSITIFPVAIASLDAFGSPKLNLKLLPAAIASVEAFGSPQLNLRITPVSIISGEVFGLPQLNLILMLASIASLEAFGTPNVVTTFVIYPLGIPSEEGFGIPTIASTSLYILPVGIASVGAFGEPRVLLLPLSRRRIIRLGRRGVFLWRQYIPPPP